MKPTIVLIPVVPYHNARKVCELVENQSYPSYSELREYLNKELEVEDDDEQPLFYSLTDFMEECNDQYINLEHYFISYVYVN
jgi:hypothetical protein